MKCKTPIEKISRAISEISRVVCFWVLSVVGYTTPVYADKVEVFLDGNVNPVQLPGIEVVVYDLDEVTRFKNQAKTFRGEDAEAQARRFIESPAFDAYQNELKRVYTPIMKMVEYQLMKVPAVVFEEGRYVVYGTTDVRQALQDYRNFLATESYEANKGKSGK